MSTKYKTYLIAYKNGKNRKVRGLLTETTNGAGRKILKGEVVIAQVGVNQLVCEELIDVTDAVVTTKG